MKVLVWVVLVMIFYDLSVHLVFLFKKEDVFMSRGLNYWPEWRDKTKSKIRYQQFWSAFWGIAFVLLLIYLIRT